MANTESHWSMTRWIREECRATIARMTRVIAMHDTGHQMAGPALDFERERARLARFKEHDRLLTRYLRTRDGSLRPQIAALILELSNGIRADGFAGVAAQAEALTEGSVPR